MPCLVAITTMPRKWPAGRRDALEGPLCCVFRLSRRDRRDTTRQEIPSGPELLIAIGTRVFGGLFHAGLASPEGLKDFVWMVGRKRAVAEVACISGHHDLGPGLRSGGSDVLVFKVGL